MKRALLSLLTVTACGVSADFAANYALAQSLPKRADKIHFQKRKIKIAGKTISVEVADTDERRQRGLMFRESLPEDQGMLFIFATEQTLSFWMVNTLIPLSIGYFNQDKKLVDIQEMVPAVVGERNVRTYPSKAPAMYALEMSPGWYQRNNITPGASFSFADKK